MKSRVLSNFLVEFRSLLRKEAPQVWTISMDYVSNLKGSQVRVVLEGSRKILIEKSLRVKFEAKNNQTEYEALISRMTLDI